MEKKKSKVGLEKKRRTLKDEGRTDGRIQRKESRRAWYSKRQKAMRQEENLKEHEGKKDEENFWVSGYLL